MWLLDNPLLPTAIAPESTGAPIFVTDLGHSAAPIAQIDLQSTYRDVGIILNWVPTIEQETVPPYTGNSVPIALEPDVVRVDAVTSNGITFLPAIDPSNPQPGELVWSPETSTVTLFTGPTAPLEPGLQVQILAGLATEATPTDFISGSILAGLAGLPILGDFEWTESAEQHPSGSLSFVCMGETIRDVRSRFRKGSEIDLVGLAFSITAFDEHLIDTNENPQRIYEVKVSLNGKWGRPKYNRPAFLRPEFAKRVINGGNALDPDCAISSTPTTTSGTTSSTKPTAAERPTISIQQLASQHNVPFIGAGTWTVPIARDSARDATVNWLSEMQAMLRQNRCFLDLSSPSGVIAKNLDTTNFWSYRLSEINVAFQGETEHSSDHVGYAVEYPNTKIEGKFSETPTAAASEVTQGDQTEQWVRRKPKRITLESGHPNPASPPDNTTAIKTLTLNWDNGGNTKTLKRSTTEDGCPIEEEEWIYGFAFTVDQIPLNDDDEMVGDPAGFWQIVQYKKTIYEYDEYGYDIGYETTGWSLGRFEVETDEEFQTIAIDTSETEGALEVELYRFRKLPIHERNKKELARFSSYYKDAKDEPAFELVKRCNRDGTSTMYPRSNPTWAPSMFVIEEVTYTSSFASTLNPDFDPEDPTTTRYRITGEESMVARSIEIVPSKNTRGVFSSSSRDEVGDEDRYIEHNFQDSSKGAGFSDQSLAETFTDNPDRPQPANRKPPLMELRKPEPPAGSANQTKSPTQYQYIMRTPGWEVTDPIGDSVRFPYATTPELAIAAAKTALQIRDAQESVQYSYKVPFNLKIKPLDRLQAIVPGDTYATRVLSVKNKLSFQGSIDGYPDVRHNATEISAGIDREIPVEVSKEPEPGQGTSSNSPVYDSNVTYAPKRRINLIELMTSELRTRRNF